MDMIFFIGLTNLFFVPMLPVYLYYKKRGQPLKAGMELLFQYGAAVSLLIPITKAVTFLLVKLLHVSVPVESSYYTLAALAAAWLLPHLDSLFKGLLARPRHKKQAGPQE